MARNELNQLRPNGPQVIDPFGQHDLIDNRRTYGDTRGRVFGAQLCQRDHWSAHAWRYPVIRDMTPPVSIWDINAYRWPEVSRRSDINVRHDSRAPDASAELISRAKPCGPTDFDMRIVAVGTRGHGVLTALERARASADLRFVHVINDIEQRYGDFAVFVGDTSRLCELGDQAVDARWSLAIALDARPVALWQYELPELAHYDQLLWAGVDTRISPLDTAVDMLDMLITAVMRDGIVGTDTSDIRRVLTMPGVLRFLCHRGSDSTYIRTAINTALSGVGLDGLTTGLLVVIAGRPHDLSIDTFIECNERIDEKTESIEENLVTLKTLESGLDDRFAIAIWAVQRPAI